MDKGSRGFHKLMGNMGRKRNHEIQHHSATKKKTGQSFVTTEVGPEATIARTNLTRRKKVRWSDPPEKGSGTDRLCGINDKKGVGGSPAAVVVGCGQKNGPQQKAPGREAETKTSTDEIKGEKKKAKHTSDCCRSALHGGEGKVFGGEQGAMDKRYGDHTVVGEMEGHGN